MALLAARQGWPKRLVRQRERRSGGMKARPVRGDNDSGWQERLRRMVYEDGTECAKSYWERMAKGDEGDVGTLFEKGEQQSESGVKAQSEATQLQLSGEADRQVTAILRARASEGESKGDSKEIRDGMSQRQGIQAASPGSRPRGPRVAGQGKVAVALDKAESARGETERLRKEALQALDETRSMAASVDLLSAVKEQEAALDELREVVSRLRQSSGARPGEP